MKPKLDKSLRAYTIDKKGNLILNASDQRIRIHRIRNKREINEAFQLLTDSLTGDILDQATFDRVANTTTTKKKIRMCDGIVAVNPKGKVVGAYFLTMNRTPKL